MRFGLLAMSCVAATVTLSGCSDEWLTVAPKAALDREVLANEQGVHGLLLGTYARLTWSTGGEYGGWANSRNQYAHKPSDDSGNPGVGGTDGNYRTFNNHDAFAHVWSFLFHSVQRANDALRLLERARDTGGIAADIALQLEAEARFLRGYFHKEATLIWGNIPYIDETVSYSAGNYKVRNDLAVWPRIEADFMFAADNLTPTKAQVGRVNAWAAKAYLAKAYMFQLKWAEAKPLLEDIIANGVTANGLPYELNPLYWDNFNTTGKHGPEIVFAVQNATHTGAWQGNPGFMYNGPYGTAANDCCGMGQASEDLVDAHRVDEDGLPLLFYAYRENPIKIDLLRSAESFTPDVGYVDPRLDHSIGRRGIPYLDWGVNPGLNWARFATFQGPYIAKKNIASQARADAEKENNQTSNQYPLVRFADILLWAAEVEVEIGDLVRAEAYVNRVRQRAANPAGWVRSYMNDGDPLAGFAAEPAANYRVGLYDGHFSARGQAWAREAVRMERRIELAMEHHRYFDLYRYDLQEPGYMARTLNEFTEYRRAIAQTAPSYYSQFDQYHPVGIHVFTAGRNEVRPIPQDQIDLSIDESGVPTLVQNPGYDG